MLNIINSGDTAYVFLCTALVCLMTPALAIFYGGMARGKNIVTMLFQNIVCMGVVGLLWVFGGFGLVFGNNVADGLFGNIGQYFALIGVGEKTSNFAPHIPILLFFAYQMMFAIITPALITGAIAGRVRFGAYLKFVILWMIFVYFPVAHWIWGGGFLAKLGVSDYAGGIVIHETAGITAIVFAAYLGKRKLGRKESERPNNIPLIALATGLLWFGWFGFNAGGTFRADGQAATAFINTFLAGATAMLVWMFWQTRGGKKLSFVQAMVGAVAGLATITPAAGYVAPHWAIVIGALGATFCYFAKYIQKWGKFDDALEVFRAHGIGGMTGALCVGIFATAQIGGVSASFHQFVIQLLGIIVVGVYTGIITFIILRVVKFFGPVRVSDEEERVGLDASFFDEYAYGIDETKD
ncbi:MAG: ammonium transporter [Psittacicella sp.]